MRLLSICLGKGRAGFERLTPRNALRRLLTPLALAIALAAPLQPANAFESERDGLKVTPSSNRAGSVVLYWRGPIMPPMANQIRDAFEAHKRQANRFVLRISSQGGLVNEGERVIDVLRQIKTSHQLDTVVTHGDVCASMCVFIYVQGQKRIGALTSSWLFHEVSHMDLATKQLTRLDRSAWERLVDKYFPPAGVSGEWVTDMKPRTVNSDYWQTGADLINARSGMIHEALGNQTARIVTPPPTKETASAKPAAPRAAPAASGECKKYFASIGAVLTVPCS